MHPNGPCEQKLSKNQKLMSTILSPFDSLPLCLNYNAKLHGKEVLHLKKKKLLYLLL
jgi:hypothetical protein